jgi:uncharacterized protein YjbI with pentapeptide repeats
VAQEPRTAQKRALELLSATLATSSWLPTTEATRFVWAMRGAIVLVLLVLVASAVDKTLWNWLDLLIVPIVLAIGGYLFTRSENQRTREIAEQRTQDDLLQAYLDDITELLVDEERPLHRASQGDNLSTVARARTLTILPCLDHTRKKRVLQFLYEAELIRKHRVVVALKEADLSEADLHQGHLRRASLRWADLSDANLSGADLSEADLSRADLSKADLSRADLSGANLRDAKGVTQEQLEEEAITLAGATMPDGSTREWRPG